MDVGRAVSPMTVAVALHCLHLRTTVLGVVLGTAVDDKSALLVPRNSSPKTPACLWVTL